MADRIGRRNTIVTSMFSAAVAMLLLSQARTLPAFALLAALAALTSELYRPTSTALLADLTPPEHRVTAFAGMRLAVNAGWAFGPAMAGFLAEHSFLRLFVGDALTSALFGVIAWGLLPHGLRTEAKSSRWGMALFRESPMALWLSCGGLGFLAVTIIALPLPGSPGKTTARPTHNSESAFGNP